jgi:hypothetical protein
VVQNHVAQGIDLLDRVSVVLPHLTKLREVIGNEGGGQLVSPEIHVPARVHVDTALSHVLPLCDVVFGARPSHSDMVQDRGYTIVERRGARLLDAVVGEAEVEAIGLAGDEELLRVVPPYQGQRCQRPDIVEERAGAK